MRREATGILRGVALVVLASVSLACLVHCRAATSSAGEMCTSDASVALYERRIQPILKDDHPTSCNQCHLAGINLSLFVKSTPCQTMACLVKLGLVDFGHPENSTVLSWIGRAKPQSQLITAAVIANEHDGLLEWIKYSAACGGQVCETFADPCGENQADASIACDPLAPVNPHFTDPQDCGELTLEQLFSADVYEWRERCYPCHFTTDQAVPSAPKWITDAVSSGSTAPDITCATGSLSTMRTVLSRGYVDLDTPSQSLLLLKPLSVEGGGVAHGGGAKFSNPNDPSYQTFLAWITRYAACAAQDPSLPKVATPPPVSTATDVGSAYSIYGYCNCVLIHCHDQAHAKWGPTDEMVIAGCRAEAIGLPLNGGPIASGNFLECRAGYCEQEKVEPDACSAALGDTICR